MRTGVMRLSVSRIQDSLVLINFTRKRKNTSRVINCGKHSVRDSKQNSIDVQIDYILRTNFTWKSIRFLASAPDLQVRVDNTICTLRRTKVTDDIFCVGTETM